jgi:hypothetical protein
VTSKKSLTTLLVALMLPVLCVGICVLLAGHKPHVTLERFFAIKVGMNCREIESLLGAPPGDYRTGPTTSAILSSASSTIKGGALPPPNEIFSKIWESDTAVIVVDFDDSGKTLQARCIEVSTIDQTWIENVIWRFKRTFGR